MKILQKRKRGLQTPEDGVTEDCFVNFVIHKSYLSVKSLLAI